ncbi:BTB/POZ domain-containing protein 3-like [Sitodiplosis mosellana]|uniref:BTB/POZ domain-containing protein 3-like n=1 Tax=Sitodiplosis mosellana TaxID=263140 RepID=UPI0024449A43|nr:BTB/POZ domain-containing protein 3-like [Sitodiplosis mosellana]
MSVIQESTGEYDIQVATEAIKKLYGDERTADVHFIFKSKERIPAHKYLLAAASDVLDAMFYGSIKEKGDVEMDDASAVGFKEFLRFFYFNKVKLTMANISDVMNLGQKYNVTECFDLCVRFLAENLTIFNALEVHSLAVLFEQDDLKTKCEYLIEFHTEEILKSTNFLECDQRHFNTILKLDSLSCSEAVVFEAAMSWVKAASNQEELTKDIVQTHLGDLFHEIRFRSMSHNEFIDLLPSYGKLFSADEFNEILQMIRNAEYQPKIFNALPRTPTALPWDEEVIIRCDRLISGGSRYPYRLQKIEITSFTTNKPILLGYFMCAYIWIYRNGQYEFVQNTVPADVTIVRVSNRNECQSEISECMVLHTMKVELRGHVKNSIKLSKPIIIRPEFKYEIRMNIDISEGCVTVVDLKSEVNLRNGIIVTFHNDPLVSGERQGLVYELGFNQID